MGGDLTTAGYILWAKPPKDLPKLVPHQIAGKVKARKFDSVSPSSAQLRDTLVDDELNEKEGELFLDERAALKRSACGLTVWR